MVNIIILFLNLMFNNINHGELSQFEFIYKVIMTLYFNFYLLYVINIFKNFYIKKIIEKIYTNIYDYFLGNPEFKLATPKLFNFSLNKIEPNSKILDFGCGNGICYGNKQVQQTIINNNLKITGIDIDSVYIKKCIQRIKDEKLESNINIKLMDIFNYKILREDEKFDYMIFSESAPLMSNELIISFINHALTYLIKSNGKIIFLNNLMENKNNNMSKYKPLIKYLVMIDFGRVLTKNDFDIISESVNKKIKINLISKMRIKEILRFFYLEWLYIMVKLIGISNYDVEQYEIIFF